MENTTILNEKPVDRKEFIEFLINDHPVYRQMMDDGMVRKYQYCSRSRNYLDSVLDLVDYVGFDGMWYNWILKSKVANEYMTKAAMYNAIFRDADQAYRHILLKPTSTPSNERKSKKKKKKGYIPKPVGKGEMVDVGRTYHEIPSLLEFEKEVMRLAKVRYVDASNVQVSHGGIYKASVMMYYKGEIKDALFLLVKRTVMGVQQYQMTRIFTSAGQNEGGLSDLLVAGIKGVEYHMKW